MEAPSIFDPLKPSTQPAALPPEPLHVVGRALHCAPERASHGFSREVKDESRVVGTWTLELRAPDSLAGSPVVGRAVLHACAASGEDASRHTSAFLDLQLWDAAALVDDDAERQLYRDMAQAVLERLRWLMSFLPGAWRLPAAPYALRLLPARADALTFNHARLHELLEDLLGATECIAGVTLKIFNGAPRYGV